METKLLVEANEADEDGGDCQRTERRDTRTYATHTGWAPVVPEAHPPNLSRIRKRQLSPKRFKLGWSIYICQGVHREAVDAHDVRQMSGQTLADAVYDRDASEW
ncbi:uncharacterized protein B0T23DRAFT_403992 [Neurospora hispaniola]|uniref:Uncharacterized protein n=1 Tax=Neurospora hispaniola TaxID=588809 RepID=A0AAJ0IB21_9PEZI|nr:hypothetical protein B0T23DRAFT_403992 [Neurospora hispaniola]